jgi:hypothetical protein
MLVHNRKNKKVKGALLNKIKEVESKANKEVELNKTMEMKLKYNKKSNLLLKFLQKDTICQIFKELLNNKLKTYNNVGNAEENLHPID